MYAQKNTKINSKSVFLAEEYVHPAAINSTFFSYDVSQHCDNGTLTWSNRTGSINDYDVGLIINLIFSSLILNRKITVFRKDN